MPMSNTSNRGFASMSSDKQREIARKGGRAAHEKGTAHEFTSDEARAAGRKGGERVSANREHMSRIGRLGGKRSAGRRASNGSQPGSDQNGGSHNDGGFDKGFGDGAPSASAEGQAQMSAQPGQPAM
jgi:general stress protein YciG